MRMRCSHCAIARADALREHFEKCAKTHPYTPDVLTERELIELIDEKFKHN